MPYKKAKYTHHRQKSPGQFKKETFRTVPIGHTDYSGKKFAKAGVKAVVGKTKSGKWATQSILVPKKKRSK